MLTSKSSTPSNGMIQGLLYVPDFELDDPCNRQVAEFIPSKVTRQKNLPPTNYNLIALAPWINANCTKSFLAAARARPSSCLYLLPTWQLYCQAATLQLSDMESQRREQVEDAEWLPHIRSSGPGRPADDVPAQPVLRKPKLRTSW